MVMMWTMNRQIVRERAIPAKQLPPIVPSCTSIGHDMRMILAALAERLNLGLDIEPA